MAAPTLSLNLSRHAGTQVITISSISNKIEECHHGVVETIVAIGSKAWWMTMVVISIVEMEVEVIIDIIHISVGDKNNKKNLINLKTNNRKMYSFFLLFIFI